MKQIVLALLVFCLLWGGNCRAQSHNKIKVACIGNSITAGAKLKDQLKDNYPAQLARMLGEKYDVRNFGVSGRTLLSKGNMPYVETGAYTRAQEFNPDIVVIKLGTNDSKPYNWKFGSQFKSDYLKLIETFRNLESKPEIYLCLAVPVAKSGLTINAEIVADEINPLIAEIAREQHLKLIDLYTPFLGKGDLFPDHIHPNAKGAGILAQIVYKELTGEDGELVNQPFPGKASSWKGFTRYDFEFNNKKAFVIEPLQPRTGNPWVWRARFPGWHSEMDQMLLAEGFYVAYINTNDQYGSPRAMKTWDRFYKYLVRSHNFSSRVALEGVSRGGLFVYNWAKMHPEWVSCIYAEAPVCDFKSWPGGFGSGIGSEKDWTKLKEEYGFVSDEEAGRYANNPIDNLEALAKAKVPVLHMVSLNDSVVPVAENSMVLLERYIRLGGIATVIPCTRGKQTLHGHHFPIETPRIGADFIRYWTEKQNTESESTALRSANEKAQHNAVKPQTTQSL